MIDLNAIRERVERMGEKFRCQGDRDRRDLLAEVDRLQEESRQWEKESLVAIIAERDRLKGALIAFACSCYQRRGLDPMEHEELCRYRAICVARA